MDIVNHNKSAWDSYVDKKDRWTIPVSEQELENAKNGSWNIVLTPKKPVPHDWFCSQQRLSPSLVRKPRTLRRLCNTPPFVKSKFSIAIKLVTFFTQRPRQALKANRETLLRSDTTNQKVPIFLSRSVSLATVGISDMQGKQGSLAYLCQYKVL